MANYIFSPARCTCTWKEIIRLLPLHYLKTYLKRLQNTTLHKITEYYTQWFSLCLIITSKTRTNAARKSFKKQNTGLNETCRYDHDLLLRQS
jgi:hypothetical protein